MVDEPVGQSGLITPDVPEGRFVEDNHTPLHFDKAAKPVERMGAVARPRRSSLPGPHKPQRLVKIVGQIEMTMWFEGQSQDMAGHGNAVLVDDRVGRADRQPTTPGSAPETRRVSTGQPPVKRGTATWGGGGLSPRLLPSARSYRSAAVVGKVRLWLIASSPATRRL